MCHELIDCYSTATTRCLGPPAHLGRLGRLLGLLSRLHGSRRFGRLLQAGIAGWRHCEGSESGRRHDGEICWDSSPQICFDQGNLNYASLLLDRLLEVPTWSLCWLKKGRLLEHDESAHDPLKFAVLTE